MTGRSTMLQVMLKIILKEIKAQTGEFRKLSALVSLKPPSIHIQFLRGILFLGFKNIFKKQCKFHT